MSYIFAADSMGLSSFTFFTAIKCALYRPFKVIQGQ